MIRVILSLALLLLAGCIDPVDFKDLEQKEHLVVEASFTNVPELNYVRLSYSQPYANPYNVFVLDANVFVTSSEGEHYQFVNDGASGTYYPAVPEAYGIVGHTYTLHITVDGKAYQSSPVTLKEPVPIEAVHFEVDEQVFSFKGYLEREVLPGYRVLVDYTDPANEKNFLRWTFSSVYEVSTQPWEFVDFNGNPAPKDRYARCFLREKLDRFKVVNDRLVNGRKVINQEVLFLPFERYLGVKHKLTVYQHSLTEEAYNFFRIMEQQKETSGTVFDPPPAEVNGNMFNVNDGSEQVIGFFDASTVAVQKVTILREEIDYEPYIPFKWPNDCRELPGATIEVPEGW